MNHSRHGLKDELQSQSRGNLHFDRWFEAHSDLSTMLIVTAGFLIRLRAASGTFLNPDEALHYLLANQSSWRLAYRASLTNAHPPLLTLVLYFWRGVGTSELVLRLPAVIAGTAFCWIVFKWLTRIFGPVTGFIGLILVSFLPPMIALSAEVRQYALLLFFLAGSAHLLERALAENSAAMMLLSAMSLYLALLSHYSAIVFAAALGLYSLLRVIARRPSTHVGVAWVSAQAGAIGLIVSLYVSHISKLKGEYASGTINGWLANSFFRPGHDNPILFVIARTGGVFQYVFGQLAVGDVAYLAFVAGMVLLWREKAWPEHSTLPSRQLVTLLVLPFALGAGASIARIYPYGGTRHSAFLIMFAVAGVSFLLAKLAMQQIARGIMIALLIVSVSSVFGKPHRPYMLREDQSRMHMVRAIGFIHAQVPQSDVIFVDYQTRLLLGYYLCPEQPVPFSAPVGSLEQFPCHGYRVVAAGPDLYIFNAENFLPRWDELLRSAPLKSGQAVWVMQAGWDVDLAHELQGTLPPFREITSQSFGRNITLFKLTAGQTIPVVSAQSN
ncbi:MAG TPA: glycosyltransferase family 39 protein [Terriglobales bacterium]|nr:glycosyltransferase family 39 protein [Terriglobales bacterium]